MKTREILQMLAIMLFLGAGSVLAAAPQGIDRVFPLDKEWAIQSSVRVEAKGEEVSTAGFSTAKWYPATMPATVMGVLVENKVYPDPFFGMNLRSIPGVSYPIGTNFSNIPMPADSPFRIPWWYRKEFTFSKPEGGTVWLHFDGINFRANVWLNGRQLANSKQVAGAYRLYEFNITDVLLPGKPNALALEVFPPEPTDLALTWVDWNPSPPDKNMGIWRDVYLTCSSGPVVLKYPQVIATVDMPSLSAAHLRVTAELHNASNQPVQATLRGQIEKIEFSQKVDLAPLTTRPVTFSPDQFKQLNMTAPRLWWPTPLGPQNLYDLKLDVETDGKMSDSQSVRFGIREAASELNAQGYRVFKINGKPLVIRGGGWAPDMFLRSSPEREIAELRYVKDMNLNTIRFEGKTEQHRFLDMCDREGILAIAGWCCCDHWERWNKWDDEDYEIAAESLKDQVRRIRNHPCILTWWYGSDNPPDAKAEGKYIEVLKATNWPNPYQSSATAKPPKLSEPTGLKMTGPYEYVPPFYWYVDAKRGGAYGFNTETSPGPAVPPVESLRLMLPKEHLWPIDDYWNFRAGGGSFKDLRVFTEALNARYGAATDVEDYTLKAQAMTYEGERAMFEAYTRNKYISTGVIQWMMNNAWPSMIWHLYDYYLRPAGGYFGTKKACEPLHIQYSYDDRSVVVVNAYYQEFKNLKATAKVYSLDMAEKFSKDASVNAGPDSSNRIFTIPELQGLTSTYFVKLTLTDSAGKLISSNFYWLSTKEETLNEEKATWFYTPIKSYADHTALKTLPKVDLKISTRSRTAGNEQVARITMENPSRSLAFMVRLRITKGADGEEVLPTIWQDNYFPLMPGEKREITATYQPRLLQGATPVAEVSGWNVHAKSEPVRR